MPRKSVFVLVASDHGSLITCRTDFHRESEHSAVGVGVELLEQTCYQPFEVESALGILELKRRYNGVGVVAIDCGANIGVHTVEWAKNMSAWGQVIAIEAQERLYYALAGNIALNNLFNVHAINAVVGDHDGTALVPVPDYFVPQNFGGLELRTGEGTGVAPITERAPLRSLRIDSLAINRLDFLKLDIEGMELEALDGANETIARMRPVIQVEHNKVGIDPLVEFMEKREYEPFRFGGNLVCVHRLDKVLDHTRNLHRSLLREQAKAADFQAEWTKFARSEEEVA